MSAPDQLSLCKTWELAALLMGSLLRIMPNWCDCQSKLWNRCSQAATAQASPIHLIRTYTRLSAAAGPRYYSEGYFCDAPAIRTGLASDHSGDKGIQIGPRHGVQNLGWYGNGCRSMIRLKTHQKASSRMSSGRLACIRIGGLRHSYCC